MLKLPPAKIRIFSDIFTKFASWIIIKGNGYQTIHKNILARHRSAVMSPLCGLAVHTAAAGSDRRCRQGRKELFREA